MIDLIDSPILITGCPRSGASMIAASLNVCGAFGGRMHKRHQSERRGMFENVAIRDKVVKSYLSFLNVDPDGQNPLPVEDKMDIQTENMLLIEKIILEEGYSGGPWMYKDSRLTITWPLWNEMYPNAKWIIVRRQTGAVIQSCMNTGYMRGYNTKEGWLELVHEYESRFIHMIEAGLNIKVIWPERIVHGNYGQMQELLEWVGLKWDDRLLEYVDSLL